CLDHGGEPAGGEMPAGDLTDTAAGEIPEVLVPFGQGRDREDSLARLRALGRQCHSLRGRRPLGELDQGPIGPRATVDDSAIDPIGSVAVSALVVDNTAALHNREDDADVIDAFDDVVVGYDEPPRDIDHPAGARRYNGLCADLLLADDPAGAGQELVI